MFTKAELVKLLETRDDLIIRALIVLNGNQTASEQRSESTIVRNGEGFRPCHARMGTSMAEFYQKRGYLSPKQIAYWRMKDKNGDMRIAIYWRQLAEAAEAKKARIAAAKALQTVAPVETIVATQTVDVGNAAEEEMVRQEIAATTILRAHSDEAEMQRMEADNDRRQTALEEYRKFMWKNSVEGKVRG